MRKNLISALTLVLMSSTLWAQSPTVGGSSSAGTTFWAGGEFLLWWIKAGPNFPMVTTGSTADPLPGALGAPGTRVLFGNDSLEYGSRTGARFTIGGWIDEGNFGVEGNLFYLNNQLKPTFFSSTDTGPGVQSIPLFLTDVNRSNESIYTISDPLFGSNGAVDIFHTSRLWGLEFNALANVLRSGGLTVNAFAGFRYLDLLERFSLNMYSENQTTVPVSVAITEDVRCRTQFYGVQLGGQADMVMDRFFASLRGALALGTNQQFTGLLATTTTTGNLPADDTFPGGVYVQPTNAGLYRQSKFAVVPQVGVKAGVNLLDAVRISVGYDFLWWNEVVRPIDQLTRTVNDSQVYGRSFDGGPGEPPHKFTTTSFWAHGLSFMAEVRF